MNALSVKQFPGQVKSQISEHLQYMFKVNTCQASSYLCVDGGGVANE